MNTFLNKKMFIKIWNKNTILKGFLVKSLNNNFDYH